MKRQPIDSYSGPTTLAIDVSAYQGTIDWPAVARSEAMLAGKSQGRPRLVIVRSSDGVQTRRDSKPDPLAVRNLRGAHEAGLPVAVYHYVRGHHDARAQAELVLEVIAVAGVPVRFVALDVEGRPDDPSTPDTDEAHGAWWRPKGALEVDTDEVLRDVAAMADALEERGHRVVIYSGVAWHWHVSQTAKWTSGLHLAAYRRLARLALWTPYYTRGSRPLMPVDPTGKPAPWATWTFWQYSAEGRIAGIDAPLDLNRFRGDGAALDAWLAEGPPRPARTAALAQLDAMALTYQAHPSIVDAVQRARELIAKAE